MTRALIVLDTPEARARAIDWCGRLPTGTRLEFKAPQRSIPQNDKLWAMLTEVATQLPWHGIKLSADDYKFIFIDALKRELRLVPNIDGTGFVNLGRSSSDLSKAEMSDLIELIHAFGAEHGVKFRDDESNCSSSTNQESPGPGQALGDGEADAVSPGGAASPQLPGGWGLTYAAALRRAQSKASLPKLASQFWAQYGGWEAHKTGPNAATATAIYDAFQNNFGDRPATEDALRELV